MKYIAECSKEHGADIGSATTFKSFMLHHMMYVPTSIITELQKPVLQVTLCRYESPQ
jgi:hypothetical protein